MAGGDRAGGYVRQIKKPPTKAALPIFRDNVVARMATENPDPGTAQPRHKVAQMG